MLTITTKYLCPTDTKGARITASTSDGNAVTTPYAYECGATEAHARALWRWIERHTPNTRHTRWTCTGDGDVRHWLPADLAETFTRPTTEAR